MDDWRLAFIQAQRVARLATVGADGQPHVVPIVYAFDGERLYTPLDAKSKRVEVNQLRRVRDIRENPRVAVVIDEYDEDWSRLAWVQIRGKAWIVEDGADYEIGLSLLREKYRQYESMPLAGCPLIVITVDSVTGWRASIP